MFTVDTFGQGWSGPIEELNDPHPVGKTGGGRGKILKAVD